MKPTGWTFIYTDANGNNPTTVPFENIGINDGSKITCQGVKIKFATHDSSSLIVRVPNVNPAGNPKIPFKSNVILKDNNGTPQFVGRRINVRGSASPNSQFFDYVFMDAWWDLNQITYKQAWFAGGGYTPVKLAGNTLTFVSFGNALSGAVYNASSVRLYDSNNNFLGAGNIQFTGNFTATISGFTGNANNVAFASIVFLNADTVLMQFYPNDPYLPSKLTEINYYITTGAQIQEILAYAISVGVNLKIGEIDPALYVPWYTARAVKCADAIKICLRMHPDCFSEIDYTTTPPTFNIRQRSNLVSVLLPYAGTDVNNRMHLTSEVNPRPELIPSRVGIFYRITLNGQVVAYPQDVYPPTAPDGILAMDYSLDLQGPRTTTQLAEITSNPFDPTNSANGIIWWLSKCKNLTAADILPNSVQMCDVNGNVANPTGNLTVVDDGGNPIDYVNTYSWELVKGTVDLWMGPEINVVYGNVSTYFTYKQIGKNGAVKTIPSQKSHTVRVKLVNTPSIAESFSQVLSTGESIPNGLAKSTYEALQPLQYDFSHKIKERPFGGTFIKPGKHGMNLQGGNSAWLTMNATVQESKYTLNTDGNGVVWAEADIKCGPVAHLEIGDLVQLYNLFANRDLTKIDPWERITGTSNLGSSAQATDDVPRENSITGDAQGLVESWIANNADGNGNFTVIQHDARTSGIQIYKWNGASLNGDSTPAPAAGQAVVDIDLSQVASGDLPNIGTIILRNVGNDVNGKPVYLLASGIPQLGGSGGTINFSIWSQSGTYSVGSIVRVVQTGTIGGITLTPGTYICAAANTGQVPQFPEPSSGTIYWYMLSLGPQLIQACTGTGQSSVWVNASGLF